MKHHIKLMIIGMMLSLFGLSILIATIILNSDFINYIIGTIATGIGLILYYYPNLIKLNKVKK